MEKKYPTIVMATFHLLFIILFVYSVIVAKNILSPIALGILFSYLLFPLASFMERIGLPRILAILLTIILAIIVIAALIFLLYKQLSSLVSDFPTIKVKALHNVDSLLTFIESHFGVAQSKQKVFVKQGVANMLDNGSVKLGEIFTATTGSILRTVILPVFIFFMLFYRDKAYQFIYKVSKPQSRVTTEKIVEQISHVTKHYVGGVSIVVMILCVLNPLGLYIVGIDYAFLLGIIAAVCNFIPYFGTILGFSFPLMFAILTYDTPHYALGVIVIFAIVQFIENNILTPNIVGGNVRINPFIIIVSLIIGGMVWGVVGMLIIVPLMAVFRIICENIEKYKPYAYLIGIEGAEKHAVTFDKIIRIFHKSNKN